MGLSPWREVSRENQEKFKFSAKVVIKVYEKKIKEGQEGICTNIESYLLFQ